MLAQQLLVTIILILNYVAKNTWVGYFQEFVCFYLKFVDVAQSMKNFYFER